MKFQKFPFLVQKQIMEGLDYADIFCLSLTSTRTARITRCFKFVRVSKVLYGQAFNGFDVYIKEYQNDKFFPVGSVEIKRSRNFKYLFSTKLGGSKINFECQKNDEDIPLTQDTYLPFKNLLFCRDDPKKIISKSMVEHASSLFGQSPVVALDACFDASLDVTPVVPAATEMYFISSKKINAKGLQFIKNHSNLKFLSTVGHWTVEPDFSDISYLKMDQSDHWASSVLRSYEGKHLELQNAKLGKEEILNFIRKWMKNDGYQNIECILIDLKERIDDAEDAMREIGSAFWDPNRHSRFYECSNPAYNKHKFLTSTLKDIRRDGDNQLASFYIWPKKFSFVVWK